MKRKPLPIAPAPLKPSKGNPRGVSSPRKELPTPSSDLDEVDFDLADLQDLPPPPSESNSSEDDLPAPPPDLPPDAEFMRRPSRGDIFPNMAMDFRRLVDDLPLVEELSGTSNQNTRSIISFLKARQQVEAQYARSLGKVISSVKLKDDSKNPSFLLRTHISAARVSVASHERYAADLDALTEDMVARLGALETERRKLVQTGNDHMKALQESFETLRKEEEEYIKSSADALENRLQFQKALHNPMAKAKELAKCEARCTESARKLEAVEREWLEACKSTRSHQDMHYDTLMPAHMSRFQTYEEGRAKEGEEDLHAAWQLLESVAQSSTAEAAVLKEYVDEIDLFGEMLQLLGGHSKVMSHESVRELKKPQLSGLLEVYDYNVNRFKLRHCVLSNNKLYAFKHAASETRKNLFELKASEHGARSVRPIDDSRFGASFVFVVDVDVDGGGAQLLRAPDSRSYTNWMAALGRATTPPIPDPPVPSVFVPYQPNYAAYRTCRRGRITVGGARNLPKGEYVCQFVLNGLEHARTAVVLGPDPVFDQTFLMDDIADIENDMKINVIKGNKTIAYVAGVLDNIEPHGVAEEAWYPATGFSTEVFVSVSIVGATVHPLLDYTDFLKALDIDAIPHLHKLLSDYLQVSTPPAVKQGFADDLLRIYSARLDMVSYVNALIEAGMHHAPDKKLSTCLAGLTMKTILKHESKAWCGAIEGVVAAIADCKGSCEVDPALTKDVAANWKRLNGFVDGAWKAILHSASKFSREIRDILHQVRLVCSAGTPGSALKAVAAYVFGDVFISCLRNPGAYNLLPDKPRENTKRTLNLVADIIERLSMMENFGAEQPLMQNANAFIRTYTTTMETFLDLVSTQPSESDLKIIEVTNRVVPKATGFAFARHVAFVHRVLVRNEGTLRKKANEEGEKEILALVDVALEAPSSLLDA